MPKPRASSLPEPGTVPLVSSALRKKHQFDKSEVCVQGVELCLVLTFLLQGGNGEEEPPPSLRNHSAVGGSGLGAGEFPFVAGAATECQVPTMPEVRAGYPSPGPLRLCLQRARPEMPWEREDGSFYSRLE